MDQELKQRLIGAVVVTALAAIFIPMLFDDPIDDKTQQVSELAIPATPPVSTGETAIDKAPENSEQVLNPGNPEEGFVEDPNGAEDEPMQPIEGPDVDDEEGLTAVKPVAKGKDKDKAKGKKAKPDVDDIVIPPVPMDEESDEKIDAEVQKLRPKPLVKREPPKLVIDKTAKPVDQAVKTVIDEKPVTVEKIPALKKPVTEAEAQKAKLVNKPAPIAPTVEAEKKSTAASDAAKKLAAASKLPAKPKKWVIQVGSFGKKENAVSLSESLRKDGFPVSVVTVQGEKGPIYRLKIGPDLDGKHASDMKARLDKQNVKAILTSE